MSLEILENAVNFLFNIIQCMSAINQYSEFSLSRVLISVTCFSATELSKSAIVCQKTRRYLCGMIPFRRKTCQKVS